MGSRLESKSSQVRKRIEDHSFDDEAGEEYEPSRFGGFGEYFRRKKIKLQNLDADMRASSADKPQIFKGVVAHVTGFTQPPLHVCVSVFTREHCSTRADRLVFTRNSFSMARAFCSISMARLWRLISSRRQ